MPTLPNAWNLNKANSLHSCELLSHPEKTLLEHLGQVLLTCREIAASKEIRYSDLGLTRDLFIRFIETVGAAHDFGKSTRYFQEYLRSTDDPDYVKPIEANHGVISAIFTYHALKTIIGTADSEVAAYLPYIGFFIVKRHHGNLKNAKDEILDAVHPESVDHVKNQIKSIDHDMVQRLYDTLVPGLHADVFLQDYRAVISQINEDKFVFDEWLGAYPTPAFCLLMLMSYSILISADKTEASGTSVQRCEGALTEDLVEVYREAKGYGEAVTDIDEMRNAIYTAVSASVTSADLATKIMSITAPTGTGKTLTALSAALKLRHMVHDAHGYYPRIIYSLPFLSIIDQNFGVFEDVLTCNGIPITNDVLLKHHHLAEVFYATRDNEFEPDRAQFLIEGWNSEIIVTTFVQFFHSLFTNKNRSLRKFHNIVNSIIILDEVQAIPHKYWKLLDDFLRALGHYFGTYVILVTATQPLIFEGDVTELLTDRSTYFEKLNRVRLYPHVNASCTFTEFTDIVRTDIAKHPTRSFLIVLNTINCAREMYERLREVGDDDTAYYYLSTHVTPRERLQRIRDIKRGTKRAVIVSTQLVEAGVDIDVDVVYRDFAPLDSINQVSGRCNRNDRSDTYGIVHLYVVNDNKKDVYKYIYSGLPVDKTRDVFKAYEDSATAQNGIKEAHFLDLINRYFTKIKGALSEDEAKELLQSIKKLEFDDVAHGFKLIDETGYEKFDLFVQLNGHAVETWERYMRVRSLENPFERRRAFLQIKREFYEYVISVPARQVSNEVMDFEYMGRLPYESLDTYYDAVTGFKPRSHGVMIL